ncbi:hypothetical protein DICSQDRAFT_171899 [Dichomitus squalens LYAD-421 SS1]|uniref:Uncharacterized protein n=1 Tax=Dichomitus squalens (strain LYAD-421) TaxID=732165 RepID=R7STU7_DICSQ|nr:uncharacterized protein DICSQDRAFT_171899 [Dichomitus squalens LYAD-421 SS1]EJF59496.1 hypothetical protein DICSQDRAFT_171899 [Dichomitus squalens LYAD-421 SS1]
MQVLELAAVSRRPCRSAVLDSSDTSPLRNGAYSISQTCCYITPDICLPCGSLAGGGIVFAGPFYPLVDFELLMPDNWQAYTRHFLMRDLKTNIDSLYGDQNVANTRMDTMTIYYVQGNTTRFPSLLARQIRLLITRTEVDTLEATLVPDSPKHAGDPTNPSPGPIQQYY